MEKQKGASANVLLKAKNGKPKISRSGHNETSKANTPDRRSGIQVGGFIKLEADYDLNADLGDRAFPDKVPVKHTNPANEGNFNLNARESRLTFKAHAPTGSVGPITAFVGVDFYGEGGTEVETNGHGLRLRQAYVTWNHWLAGQAWTNFADFKYGHVIDLSQPVGANVFPRQSQLRYSFHLSSDNLVAVSLENPEGRILTSKGVAGTSGNGISRMRDSSPDLTARYEWKGKTASFQLGGLARYLTVAQASTLQGSQDVFAWGANIGATYTLPSRTTFMLQGTYGEGIGRYLAFPTSGAAVYVNRNGHLSTVKKWGWIATISQKLSPKLTANIIYGTVHVGDISDTAFDTADLDRLDAKAYLNLFYSVTEKLKLGVEYLYLLRQLQDGSRNNANRIEAAAYYYF